MNIPAPKIAILNFFLQLTLLACPSRAAPGDVDLSFDPGSGIDGPVSTVAVQADGKLIIGGSFRTANGLVRPGIARLHADGSGDASFDPVTAANDVYSRAVLQSDGKVLVSGDFAMINGTGRTLIARLNGDGSRDGSFDAAIGKLSDASGYLGWLAVQPDGKVLITGSFTTVTSTNRTFAARLHSDGSLDSSFSPLTDVVGIGSVYVGSTTIQPDGKILIGGQFTTLNGAARNGLARLNADGSLDLSFNPVSGINRLGTSTAVLGDGKLLIAGYFYNTATGTRQYVSRLNANGSVDSSYNSNIPYSPYYARVYSIALQPDGKLLVGGNFTEVNGTPRNGIARLNANGTLDSSFNPGTGVDQSVNTIALQEDGKVLIGGPFSGVNGTARPYLARLNVNGSVDSSFKPGSGIADTRASLWAVAVQPDGKVLIGGSFTSVSQASHSGIARLRTDGSLDSSFNAITDGNGAVLSLAVQPDGKVLIGGTFTTVNTISRNRIARLNADGSLDPTFDPGFGPSNNVLSLALQPDGKVLIGGLFGTVNGNATRGGFARLNADGSLDTTFASSIFAGDAGSVYAITVQPDGKIIRGGQHLARVDATGSLDQTFDPGAGPSGWVFSVVLQSDGRVLIGGLFGTVNGTVRTGLARLNADGSLDGGFDPAVSGGVDGTEVESLALQPDGKVLVGGNFTMVNGTARHSLARLNPDGSLDSSFDPGIIAGGSSSSNDGPARTEVHALSLQADGELLVGGNFTTVNGVARWRVARLLTAPPPSLDIALSNGFAILSWPGSATGYRLQETPDLTLPDAWIAVPQPVVTNGGQLSVTVPIAPPRKYFRLISP